MTVRGDERGVSTTVSYAITLVITTLLITGLLTAGGDFVQNQREQATLSELRVLGQQLADDVSAADRLARTADPDGDVTMQRGLPERVAGSSYRVSLRSVAPNISAFRLASDNPDEQTEVRIHSTTPLFMKTNLTGGETEVTYNSVREELVVRRPGPFVFQEASGNVSIEAESYPEDHPGEKNASTHYWKAFDDSDASGDEAVVMRPDTSDHTNTHDNLYGPRVEYEVNFQTTGTYYIWVRTDGPDSNGDSVHVAVNEDGSWEPGTYGGLGVGTYGGWGWRNDIPGDGEANFTVDSAGTHTVAVWMREDGTRVDKIVLTTTHPDDWQPSGDGPTESEWS